MPFAKRASRHRQSKLAFRVIEVTLYACVKGAHIILYHNQDYT